MIDPRKLVNGTIILDGKMCRALVVAISRLSDKLRDELIQDYGSSDVALAFDQLLMTEALGFPPTWLSIRAIYHAIVEDAIAQLEGDSSQVDSALIEELERVLTAVNYIPPTPVLAGMDIIV